MMNKTGMMLVGLILMGSLTAASQTAVSQTAVSQTERLQLIPMPQKVTFSDGEVLLPRRLTVGGDFAAAAEMIAEMITDIIARSGTGVEVSLVPVDEPAGAFVRLSRDPSLATEAYRLRSDGSGIVIEAADDNGALWGVQTLRQLILQAALQGPAGGLRLPAVVIEDAPRFAWRGFHLDLARHMFTTDYLKKTIERLANYKINKLHLHLSDDQGWRLQSEAFPLLTETGGWRPFDKYDSICIRKSATDPTMVLDKRFLRDDTLYGGYYTREEMKEIIAHASRYGIEVIPEIDMPGHMSAAIKAYPWLSCSGAAGWGEEFSHPLCTAKPEVRAFARKILDEVAELFSSPYIHIGADEVETSIWEQCPRCREEMRVMKMNSPRELQSRFVEEMHDHLTSIGKKTVVWDDAAEEKVSNEMLVTFWRDWKGENAAQIVERGHPMVFATWSHFYLSSRPSFKRLREIYRFDISKDYPGMSDELLMGYQACVWTEEIPTEAKLEEHLFPALQAFSERVWSSNRDWDAFLDRIPLHYRIMDGEEINYHAASKQ